MAALLDRVTLETWGEIVNATVAAAKSGDTQARTWLAAYLLGKPGQLSDIDAAAIGSELSVLGRFLVTKQQPDVASFKTPDLRNVLGTGP